VEVFVRAKTPKTQEASRSGIVIIPAARESLLCSVPAGRGRYGSSEQRARPARESKAPHAAGSCAVVTL
jgi:hypothetical protein